VENPVVVDAYNMRLLVFAWKDFTNVAFWSKKARLEIGYFVGIVEMRRVVGYLSD
jgi:hypothetical protein